MALELNGTTGVSLVQDGVVVAADLNSALSDTIGKLKAWVNFNGTGTVSIKASYGVASITDNGTGDYTVNFTTAMADANYAVVFGGVQRQTAAAACRALGFHSTDDVNASAYSTTAVRIVNKTSSGTGYNDASTISVSIFR